MLEYNKQGIFQEVLRRKQCANYLGANGLTTSRHLPIGNEVRPIFNCFLNHYEWQILKGSDDGVQHSELLGFWTLSIVWYSRKWKTRRFGNWIYFRPQVITGLSD
jgi:hypothetical protein